MTKTCIVADIFIAPPYIFTLYTVRSDVGDVAINAHNDSRPQMMNIKP